ncbi:hypothetical protein QQS21_011161 [Conoideocrella luteorostrata]|uniref:Transcription factor TFIIIC triple barrel domain-containing protein n=1 Tax=Conoideocrella luteorostrata TaxID=1105319 RepID=A0AAJ0FNT4_9HYPO|nr:hypothetical protein QQS21_011161 [Conoideocrella luteorostrata]
MEYYRNPMDRPEGVFSSNEPGALSLDQILAQVSKDDQEDWEYEYSTTEEETFYLTIELSYPEFKEQSTRANHHSRGGYYKHWQDNDPSTSAKPSKPTSKQDVANNSDDNDNDDAIVADHDDDDVDDGTPLDPALRAISKGKEPASDPVTADKGKSSDGVKAPKSAEGQDENESTETEDIQILELHSSNPIIAYRGRLFEGQWAEVIGTEAILTQHDPTNALPALRNLPGDIDLLAASSSRILTTEKIAKPRVPEQDTLASTREEWNIRIPAGKDRTGERAEQTSFLENLIALKIKRGDKDQVTVYATDGAGKDWDDRKAPDFKPRRKKLAAGEEGSDREEGGRGSKRRGNRANKRPKGRPPIGKRLDGYPVGFGDSVAKPKSLSTPTPRRWEDLTANKQNDDDDVDDDDDDNGAGSDSQDNAEGDEDVTMTG